jgi:glyoxylase-like metal-dependent hydrolase (beta-lactamase superfamily II)
MWDLPVRIIKVGSCTLDPGNLASDDCAAIKNELGLGGGSTVTVIRDQDEILLIDTGFEKEGDLSESNQIYNWQVLKAMLAFHGIAPEAVTKVFVSHCHWDHLGGIEHLSQAQWFCHHQARRDLPEAVQARFIGVAEGDALLPRAIVLHTPGHTPWHCSLLWTDSSRKIRIAVCGDAIINLAWLQSGYLWRWNSDFAGVELARESLKKLLRLADLLIPGHGQPFFATPRLLSLW